MTEKKHNHARPAVIYCRVSDSKQVRDGDGLNSQETRCREFAARKGYSVAAVFKDDITGKLVERPAMKSMLAYLRQHRSKSVVVIIDDISRLARGLSAHLELRASIAKAGGTLESPSIEFGEDADSLMVENLLATVSQYGREKNAEQTKNRMVARVMNGFWVFQSPLGYTYAKSGRGKILKRDEPVASVMQEALEGFASGRFDTQADVMRFLQDHPLFPKDRHGVVRHNRVIQFLNQPVYAGYIELPDWGIPMRPAQHEAIISLATFQRIRERLNGDRRAPARPNLSEGFPLRSYVVCDDCGSPLTAGLSKGRNGFHPYYLCHRKTCESYGKSIRRGDIEGAFETLLRTVQPTKALFKVARSMFERLWNRKVEQAQVQAKALSAQMTKIEKQVAQLLDRILDASLPSVIAAYEDRIRKLEEERHVIRERIALADGPAGRFDETFRTAMDFLANPWKLWSSGRLEDRQTVLKLVFADRLRYARNEGFRTADLSLPFKVLTDFSGAEKRMVDATGIEPVTPTMSR